MPSSIIAGVTFLASALGAVGSAVTFSAAATTITAVAIGGAVVGAVVGGVVAAVKGESILKGALKGGLIGAAVGGALGWGAQAVAGMEGAVGGYSAESIAATKEAAFASTAKEGLVAAAPQEVTTAGVTPQTGGALEVRNVSPTLVEGTAEKAAETKAAGGLFGLSKGDALLAGSMLASGIGAGVGTPETPEQPDPTITAPDLETWKGRFEGDKFSIDEWLAKVPQVMRDNQFYSPDSDRWRSKLETNTTPKSALGLNEEVVS